MQELSAIARIESRRRLLHIRGAQTPARKGAERTRGLVGEHARAAALQSRLDARRARVFEWLEPARGEDQVAVARIVRELERRFGDAGDERARRKVAVLVLGRMREDDLLRRALPFLGDAPIERGRAFGARL